MEIKLESTSGHQGLDATTTDAGNNSPHLAALESLGPESDKILPRRAICQPGPARPIPELRKDVHSHGRPTPPLQLESDSHEGVTLTPLCQTGQNYSQKNDAADSAQRGHGLSRGSQEVVAGNMVESDSSLPPFGGSVRSLNRSSPCNSACYCQCHRRASREVRIVSRLFGVMVVRTWRDQRHVFCDNCVCPREDATWSLTYYAPRRLLDSALSLAISKHSRIQISLSFPRIVPPNAELFVAIGKGDYVGVQQLLSSGLASVFDIVAPYGLTPVDFAIIHGQRDTRKLLVNNGALQLPSPRTFFASDTFTYFSNCSLTESQIPAGTVVMDIVRLQARCYEELRLENYHDIAWRRETNCTQLIKSVLGLSLQPIDDVVEDEPQCVNAVDSFRRTALHWAVATGKNDAVRKLLLYKADANLGDCHDMTPLHLAASKGNLYGIDALTSAGANVDAGDKYGMTPLHYACQTGATEAVTLLLTKHASLSTRTVFAEGPAIIGLRGFERHRRLQILKAIQAGGASLYEVNAWGINTIGAALLVSSHETVSFLVKALPHHCGELAPDKKTLLHIAALHSDLDTVETLIGCAENLDTDPDLVDSKGMTALQYIRRRKDVAVIFAPFCTLIETVRGYRQRKADMPCAAQGLLSAQSLIRPSVLGKKPGNGTLKLDPSGCRHMK